MKKRPRKTPGLVLMLAAIVFTSCSPAIQTLTTSPIPNPQPTRTPAPTLIPTATRDLNEVGLPVDPLPFQIFGDEPPDYLKFDEQYDRVFRKILHGRTVQIIFADDTSMPPNMQTYISDILFRSYLEYWAIFGGFPFESFTIVVRETEAASYLGVRDPGFETVTADLINDPFLCQKISHELFHAWNGRAIRQMNYNDSMWFLEGVTQYYGLRACGPAGFRKLMSEMWDLYVSFQGTSTDIPLTEMPAEAERTGDPAIRQNVYWKGALLSYLIDLELSRQGMTLDALMRTMYVEFGLTGQTYTTADVVAALEQISGRDWSDFMGQYLYGNDPLPLEGVFEYLQH